jgi:hypothetical protein
VTDLMLVQEFMFAVEGLGADMTVAEALEILERTSVTLGVVRGTEGTLLATVSLEQLRAVNGNQLMQTYAASLPRPIVSEPRIPFASVVRALKKYSALDPDLVGIVVQDGDRLQGVVPGKTIQDYISFQVLRGEGNRLEGAPVDVLMFECETCPERRFIAYYDPNNPPKCSAGHVMKLVEV